MAMGIPTVGLEAPSDGGTGVAAVWRPERLDMPFSQVPRLIGGVRRCDCRTQFVHCAATATGAGPRRWEQGLADLAD
ncbi:hypothetical protein GCM10009635_56000 [Actinocatenispora thailandica]